MNNAEIIGRLGVLALNTAIEMDIYGNVNTSHIGGTSCEWNRWQCELAQNAISVMIIPSISKKVLCDIQYCTHGLPSGYQRARHRCGHHRNGVCDLRGLDDTKRANGIIQSCAASEYRDELLAYLEKAKKISGHHPQIPEDAFTAVVSAWPQRNRVDAITYARRGVFLYEEKLDI